MSEMLDPQVLALPKVVRYCCRCVMSNQRPRILFDDEGICSACRFAEFKASSIDWNERHQELCHLLDKFRSTDGSFDVVVPCSGGKDSSTIAHRLKHEFGMNPLCVTFSPPIYSEIGWQNLQSFIKAGFNHILVSPSGAVHRPLTRLCFEVFGDHNEIFDRGQMAAPFRVAMNYGIKLVMYGENGEAEYGGTTDFNLRPSPPWHEFERIYYSQKLDKIVRLAQEKNYLSAVSESDLYHYQLPPIESLRSQGVEMHWFGYYKNWVPQENFYYASEHTGFVANPEGRTEGTYSKYAQLDDATDGFLYYMMFIKYGFGRATSDAAHEVRDGHLTRDEAVLLVRKFDGEFPSRNFEEFLDYCQITEDVFWLTVDRYRQPHIWRKGSNGEWKLRNPVT